MEGGIVLKPRGLDLNGESEWAPKRLDEMLGKEVAADAYPEKDVEALTDKGGLGAGLEFEFSCKPLG